MPEMKKSLLNVARWTFKILEYVTQLSSTGGMQKIAQSESQTCKQSAQRLISGKLEETRPD